MQVYFDALIREFDGSPIKWPQGHSLAGQEMTLGAAAVEALSAMFQDEQGLDGNAKQRRFKLATKAYSATLEDLPSEEVSEIKKVIGKMYGPLIVGRCYEILEGTAQVKSNGKGGEIAKQTNG